MSEKKKGMVVGGFDFANEAEAMQAKKEADGIQYIKEKTDMETPDMVLKVYNKMIQQGLFETAVGYTYLKDLQEYLMSIPFIDKEAILPIPVRHPVLEESLKQKRHTEKKQVPKQQVQVRNFDFKKRYQVTFFTSLILLLCVIGMFIINATSNSPTILNYETKIIDKYEMWEQELEEREAAVEERENNVGKD